MWTSRVKARCLQTTSGRRRNASEWCDTAVSEHFHGALLLWTNPMSKHDSWLQKSSFVLQWLHRLWRVFFENVHLCSIKQLIRLSLSFCSSLHTQVHFDTFSNSRPQWWSGAPEVAATGKKGRLRWANNCADEDVDIDADVVIEGVW